MVLGLLARLLALMGLAAGWGMRHHPASFKLIASN
jgi:hypothetical protein